MGQLDKYIKENDFQNQVIGYAKLCGWKVAHFRTVRILREDGSVYFATPVQADGDGFPDLVIVRRERGLAVECKSEKGKPSEDQLEWLRLFDGAGFTSYVWRPSDWDEIQELLK